MASQACAVFPLAFIGGIASSRYRRAETTMDNRHKGDQSSISPMADTCASVWVLTRPHPQEEGTQPRPLVLEGVGSWRPLLQ